MGGYTNAGRGTAPSVARCRSIRARLKAKALGPSLLAKNEVEFRLYRKFAAEAVVTFETPEPLPEEKTKEQPPK